MAKKVKTDIEYVQLQIRAFNKALSRAYKSGLVDDQSIAILQDMIGGQEFLTSKGYVKAGKGFIEKLKEENYDFNKSGKYSGSVSSGMNRLQAFASDVQSAKETLSWFRSNQDVLQEIISEAKDSKAALWITYQRLLDMGYQFDSNQVKDLADGKMNDNYIESIRNMLRVAYDDNYGQAEFYEYFNSLESLE